MNDWNIQTRAHACATCGKPFADKASYHTALFEKNRELLRLDICGACWKQEEAGGGARAREGFISYWQGLFEAPPPATDLVQKETAESLLRKLIEANDPRHIPAGYILAVMLERKRVLKVKEQLVRDGKRTFVYEQAKTGDLFTITDPDLQLSQLEQVQRDVAALLEHGLNPPTTGGATAPVVEGAPAGEQSGAATLPTNTTPPAGEPAPAL